TFKQKQNTPSGRQPEQGPKQRGRTGRVLPCRQVARPLSRWYPFSFHEEPSEEDECLSTSMAVWLSCLESPTNAASPGPSPRDCTRPEPCSSSPTRMSVLNRKPRT